MLWKQGDVLLQNTALFAFLPVCVFLGHYALQLEFDRRFTLSASWRIVSFIVLKGIILNFIVRMGPVCNHVYTLQIFYGLSV